MKQHVPTVKYKVVPKEELFEKKSMSLVIEKDSTLRIKANQHVHITAVGGGGGGGNGGVFPPSVPIFSFPGGGGGGGEGGTSWVSFVTTQDIKLCIRVGKVLVAWEQHPL